MLTPDQIALLQQWHQAQAMAAQWQQYERQCRDAVVAAIFPGVVEGSRSADPGNGYTLKFVQTAKYTVTDTPEMRRLVNQFAQHAETSAAGMALLSWKPNLSLRSFKALPDWGQRLMQHHITYKPNAPQLTLEAPKV